MIKTSLLLAFWPLCVLAQEPGATTKPDGGRVWNEMKGEKLQALKLKGDIERGAQAFVICQGCHKRGATGSVSGAYPRLAGQHATVLIEQMTDIRSGARRNPKMEPFSDDHAITIQDIADIAAYLQALPIQPNPVSGQGVSARGKELYGRDCATCHGEKGEGNATKFYPLVAGQHFRYLMREARFIRDGSRGNANPDMVKVIKPYSDDDIEAVADFMAGLEPP